MVTSGRCGLVKGGCYQGFSMGNIYWTEATGSWDVSGGIFVEYVKEGTEWGILGYPTSGERIDASGVVYQSFEHGTIYWTKAKGAWVAL